MKVLVLPDSQNGFAGSEPMHDRVMWKLAAKFARYYKPDVVVLLGDMLDFTAMGKFEVGNEALDATNPALEETKEDIVAVQRNAKEAEFKYFEGNHELRGPKALKRAGLPQYANLKRPGERWPVNSAPHLLDLDSLGVEYLSPYGYVEEIDGVLYTHGTLHGKWGGMTAAKYLANATMSIVYGHVHKRELAYRTIWEGECSREIFAMCPGTMASIKPGVVPGYHRYHDWQQSLAVVEDGHPDLCPRVGDEIRFGRKFISL